MYFQVSLHATFDDLMQLFKSLAKWRRSDTQAAESTSLSTADMEIITRVRPYTMTSSLRVEALLKAVRYVEDRQIPGAFAECGVWKGGSVLAMICQLQALGRNDRDIYLYDTFEGMTAPTSADVEINTGDSAVDAWNDAEVKGERVWGHAFGEKVFNESDVRALLLSTGYPEERLHFVKGAVEETIPGTTPDQLALLRLDTDWYESTRHELNELYPLINSGGVLIIDDYGHWDGCRKAVDEYFLRDDVKSVLLNRIDYTGRLAVKA